MNKKPLQSWDQAMAALGGPNKVRDKMYGALRTGARAKGNDYGDGLDRKLGGGPSALGFNRQPIAGGDDDFNSEDPTRELEGVNDFDVSDDEPAQASPRPGSTQRMPPPRTAGAPKYTPGVSNPNSPMRGRMMGRKPMVKREGAGGCIACGDVHQENAGCYEAVQEATPFGGPEKRTGSGPVAMPSTGNRRARSQTSQFQMRSDTPLQKPAMNQPKIATEPGESVWDVYVDGGDVYKVPAKDESEAKARAMEWLNGGGDPDHSGKTFALSSFQAVKGESVGGGFTMPMGAKMDELRAMVRQALKEIVRKKEGGGGYVLYAPNKGKKKSSKPAGEFPTRTAAKRAELARFPPKDAEQLKKMRKRIDKLTKDPKKRAEAEKRELTGRKPVKKSRKAAGARKKATRESLVRDMVANVSERLFRDEEIAGSPWDQKIANLSPDAIAQDKKLAALHKKMHQNSSWALEDAHKGLSKLMRGYAKVMPGEIAFDDNRQKMFCPCMMDVDGTEVGPIHFYIDGGHVRCEVSQEARQALAEMDPDIARDLRGQLMTFEEDHLPKISYAKDAWGERDSYLDKLHARLDKSLGGMSPVEVHLAKQLIGRRRK